MFTEEKREEGWSIPLSEGKVKQTNASAAPVPLQLYFSSLQAPIPRDLGYLQPWKAWGMSFLTSGAYFSNSLTSCYFNSSGDILGSCYRRNSGEEGGSLQGDGKGIPSSSGHGAIPRNCVRLRAGRKILNPSSLNVKGGRARRLWDTLGWGYQQGARSAFLGISSWDSSLGVRRLASLGVSPFGIPP